MTSWPMTSWPMTSWAALLNATWLFWLVLAIAAITLLTGCVQIIWPAPILGLFAAEQSPAALHFFGLVGMFMALFGAALLHAMLGAQPSPIVVLWAGIQKFCAVAGVGIGVLHGIFAPLALAVTVFDFTSGVLIFAYLWGPLAGRRPA